jgi:hypothetical protein
MNVMAHSATAMRDMIFYRIHKGVESLFNTYKTTFLPPYQLTTVNLQYLSFVTKQNNREREI